MRTQYSPDAASYQSPKLQLQHGSPRAPSSQSPLARKSADLNQNYASSLRSSLDKPSPTGYGNTPVGTDTTGRLSAAASLRKSLLDSDVNTKSGSEINNPGSRALLGDYSSYRKSLSSEHRNSAAAEQLVNSSKSIQESNHRSSHGSVIKQGHSQTPAATETTNYNSSPHAALKASKQITNTRDAARAHEAASSEPSGKSMRGSQLSVFNYEGGDRSQSRNHLHMLMNHNMMNAHQHEEDSNKKRTSNAKRTRRKITVNLQGTRYDVGE